MRCLSCNNVLSDYESTRKYKSTKTFIDLCTVCFNQSDLKLSEVTDRLDLKHNSDEDIDNESY
jgi:hypothetical protein